MSSSTTDPTLSVLVQLPLDLARTIDTLAERSGQARDQFIISFLQQQLGGSALSFEKMLAPIAEDFRRSGMTDADLDALVKQERQAMWDEKHP